MARQHLPIVNRYGFHNHGGSHRALVERRLDG